MQGAQWEVLMFILPQPHAIKTEEHTDGGQTGFFF